jgi:amidase
MDDSFATWSASRLAAAIRARELSSRELLAAQLSRIEGHNGALNAVVTLHADQALAEAAAADDDAARGRWRGPLHGLPVTIKDAIEVQGMRSTGGASELTDHHPTKDAPAVARLRSAGAVVMGKTNVPRWSGDLQTFNDVFGTTNNPWDPARVPGGSSGGPAVAVATGFSAFELGTDIGGSVRIPSHCCGIFGLKPTFGIVPQRGYLDHVGGGTTDADINVFGPLARSAEDLDLLLSVIAGPEPERELAWRLELPPPRRTELSQCRIGTWFDEPGVPLDSDLHAILRQTADALADAGAKVEEAHPPVDFGAQRDLFFEMISAAISPSLPDETAHEIGGTHRSWLAAEERRAGLRARWSDWFETFDVLLCPVMAVPPFPHNQGGDFFSRTTTINGEDRPYMELVSWTGLIGILGLPSAVPPLPRTPAGLPVGVQVVGPWLRDREVVHISGLVAAAAGGGYQAPPGF